LSRATPDGQTALINSVPSTVLTIVKSPLHIGFAKRLSSTAAAARTKKVMAEFAEASWSRARRRQRLVQAKVRS